MLITTCRSLDDDRVQLFELETVLRIRFKKFSIRVCDFD